MSLSKTLLTLLLLMAITVVALAPVGALLQPALASSFIERSVVPQDGKLSLFVMSMNDISHEESLTLQRLGTLTTVVGSVAVLHTYPDNLRQVRELPFVSRIETSHPLHVYLDKSVPEIGADMVWREVKDAYGRNVTGAGVVIGFVDTGIDIAHPDFTFPNGTTKILYVWDQTTRGRPPKGFDYGYECTSLDIEGKSCPELDSFGHGTHVAGIAASSGRATGNFTGVAPYASIIFVKSGHTTCNGDSWTFDTAEILDGINYITQRATQLGLRAVINLSLGGNIGGHDGSDPLEHGLDAFVKSGTPVVVAAGNSAQDKDHARGQLRRGDDVTLNIEVQKTTTDLAVDVWYSPLDQIDAVLKTPNGEAYAIPTPAGGARSFYGKVTAFESSSALGSEIYFEVNSNGTLPSDGWSLRLRANAVRANSTWDAWIDTAGCIFPGATFLPGSGYLIDPFNTIGIPGTAKLVVTVGAYVSKNSWRGINGESFGHTSFPVGEIASFSGLGPTRDGRIKPDVASPGIFIASARSSLVPKSDSDPDAYHRMLAGTSMAAPHVAGVVALMLQYEPNLDASEIPRTFRETARPDIHTGLIPNGSPVWGFGKADGRTATGLFRITMVFAGIPQETIATVRIDGSQTVVVHGGAWVELYFPLGTEHTLSSDAQLLEAPGTRYNLRGGNLTVTTNLLKVLNYTAQYYLSVSSKFGPSSGSGWYDANSTAQIFSPQMVPAPGILQLIGASYRFAYWVDEDGKAVSEPVLMDRPRTVTAVYVLTYPPAILVAVVLASVTIVGAVLMRKRRKKETLAPEAIPS